MKRTMFFRTLRATHQCVGRPATIRTTALSAHQARCSMPALRRPNTTMAAPPLYNNNLPSCIASNQVCKAFGVKISTNTQVVQIARNAGFDSLFIDLEHSSLSLADASNLCNVGLLSGITPFVRVPHQCGNGFVQRVLDGGAMGVIFPHVDDEEDAAAAVEICKFPPGGSRSMTGQMPVFGMRAESVPSVMDRCNKSHSTVIVMIESVQAVRNIDEIAAVPGVDVILVGSMDLTIDMGIPAQFGHPDYLDMLKAVSFACQAQARNRPVFGVAGVYDKPELQNWMINKLGARFLLVQQDISLITAGAARAVEALPKPD